MLEMFIDVKGCRGCQLCVDICPTDVLEFNEQENIAQIREVEDCIACLSCAYICPSNVIEHKNYHVVNNFYRDIEFSGKIEKFI